MKHEIIFTEHYALIVSNSEPINMGDSIYDIVNKEVHEANDEWNNDTHPEWAKVIAHRPLTDAPILKDVPLIPPFSRCQEDGAENAVSEFKEIYGSLGATDYELSAFSKGYNKAKETSQKEIAVYKNAYLKLLEFVKSKFDI